MDILINKTDLGQNDCDLLVLSDFEGRKRLNKNIKTVDDLLGGMLTKVIKEDGFKFKKSTTLKLHVFNKISEKRILLVGLGKEEEFTSQTEREISATVSCLVKKMKCKKIVTVLHGDDLKKLDRKNLVKAFVEGLILGGYTYGKYKKDDLSNKIETVEVISKSLKPAELLKAISDGRNGAEGTIFARDLVNTPGLHMAPVDLVNAAKEITKGKKNLKIKIYQKDQLEKMGAGGILAVNQGSDHEPYLVHMVYKPEGKIKNKIAVVGKAVTFDSGGLSLKPAEYMMSMKCDMGGSAALLGFFSVIDKIKPKAEVHGIFGAVENMPSGKAIRPGDVVKALNGKTIEILNTDAEGRVTLADTLSFAVKKKPDLIIDLATLTGACVVALGEEITGLMSNNAKLANNILSAAASAGEKMWELPLEKKYKKLLRSDIADIKNIGGRYGGALTAGLFLEEFVNKTPWAHLDIAGPAYAERPINSYEKKGATGHGVRTLIEFIKSI